MDIIKLDAEVKRILSQENESLNYSEIRTALAKKGYSPQELRYMMGMIDDKLPLKTINENQRNSATRNMVLGGSLTVIALLVIGSSYFGQSAPKEIYYVSLVVFAVGYLVFRNGFRRRNDG